jgi:hypothetical protein
MAEGDPAAALEIKQECKAAFYPARSDADDGRPVRWRLSSSSLKNTCTFNTLNA